MTWLPGFHGSQSKFATPRRLSPENDRALLGLWEGQRFGGIDDRPPDIRAVAANTLNCPKNARKIEPFDPKTWLFGKYELYSRRFLYGEADGEGQTLRPLRYRILFGLAVAESRPTSC